MYWANGISDGSRPARNISLTAEQDAFLDEMLRAGEYRNASEAVGDAIRALRQRRFKSPDKHRCCERRYPGTTTISTAGGARRGTILSDRFHEIDRHRS